MSLRTLCTPLERQEHICWYPIEVEPCVHLWSSRSTFVDIPLKWKIGEHHSGPVPTFREAVTHLLISHWSGTLENMENVTPDSRLVHTFREAGTHLLISHWSGTLENVTPYLWTPSETWEQIYWLICNCSGTLEDITLDLCTPLRTQEHINRYPIIEVDHGEHHSGPVHTSDGIGTHQEISNWSETSENITLDLCPPLER